MLDKKINIRIGIWLDDLRQGIKQGLKTIRPWEIESIGLDAFGPEVQPRNLTSSGRRDLGRLVRSQNFALAALLADVGGRRLADAQHLDTNLARLRDAAQLATDLGCAHMVVPGGYIPPANQKEHATQRASLAEAARALAGFASSLGVHICWQAGHEAPDVLSQFLKEVDSSGLLEVDLNPGAFVMHSVDPLKALNSLSERVSIARAVDHYMAGAEAPFGKGDVRWGEIIIGLSTLRRSQPVDLLAGCNLDGDRIQAISRAAQTLIGVRNKPF